MKKFLKYGTPVVVVLLLVVLAFAGNYMLKFSLTPYDGERTFNEEDVYAELYEDYPFMEEWVDSMKTEGALKDTTIVNRDGDKLHGYFFAAPQATDKTVVVVHGYKDCAIEFFFLGRMYNHDLNFNVLMPDLYYHGYSEGKAVQMGWKDRLDVLQWMDVAAQLFPGTKMMVHGVSMGAATIMNVSGEELEDYVKCFIEDCGYTSVWDEFKKELKEQFGLPAFPLMHVASMVCKWKYGWSFQEAAPLKQVVKCKLPMLFIHGDADTFVPTWMVYPLYEAKPEPKEIWITAGVKHAESYHDYPVEYTQKVREFTAKYMK